MLVLASQKHPTASRGSYSSKGKLSNCDIFYSKYNFHRAAASKETKQKQGTAVSP